MSEGSCSRHVKEGQNETRQSAGSAGVAEHGTQDGPTAPTLPPSERVREASPWQGGRRTRYPEASIEHAAMDLYANAWLGQLTGAISPVALAAAWQDWASHLLLSPSKMLELGTQATSNWQRWMQSSTCAIQPLAQDKRFNGPEWQTWPYRQISQGFLLTQQWWHRATTGVRGLSPHHTDVVSFIARQMLDCVAPSNFLTTNPVAQRVTRDSGGRNLIHGALRAAEEARRVLTRTPAPIPFRPGKEVAITPGKVVLSNPLMELLRYEPMTETVHEVPVLLVPAWIMKYYILDLSPDNSLVRYLVEHGHTAYMISWKNPQVQDRDLSLEDESQVSFLEAIMWRQGYLDTHQMAGAFQLLRSNDLIWSRQQRHYLLDIPDRHNDLASWNADTTRMPCRMHSEYLRKLFLNNSLASMRYMVDGRPVALMDIDIPVFAVGTLTDHVAPWRSVYKIVSLTDTEVTFLLTSGGHNAGVVSPPGTPSRSYQIATQRSNAPYIDPDSWQELAELHEDSWWPAWESWLARRAGGRQTPPPPVQGLDAPGAYVLRA